MEKIVSRKERERLQRHTDILLAAKEIFAEKGYEAATMAEIATKCELGKGTIYNYFPSKEDLFVSLFETEFRALNQILSNILDSGLEPLKKLWDLVYNQLLFHDNNKDFFNVLIQNIMNLSMHMHKDKIKILIKQHQEYTKIFTAYFENPANKMMFKDLDPEILSFCITGLLKLFSQTPFALYKHPGQGLGIDEKTDMIIELFLNGTIAEKKI